MPLEVRFLVFSADEVRAAALSFVRKQGQAISPADMAVVDVGGPKDAPTATIQLQSSAAPRTIDAKTIRLNQQDLAAALILHCAERHIPLPRSGEKKVELSVNGLTLVSTIDRAKGSPSILSGQVSYGDLANSATTAIGTVREQLTRALARADYAEKLVAQAEERAIKAEASRGKSSAALVAVAMIPGFRGRLGRWLVNFRFPIAE